MAVAGHSSRPPAPAGRPFVRWFAAAPLLLGGLLALPAENLDRVPWAGCWVFPVGDSLALGAAAPGAEPPYQVTRNVSRGRGVRVHDGADLSNRRGGGVVRAAAHGLVVFAGPGRPGSGFGWHVVLAHRELDGATSYSVYAHLAAGSVAVQPGRIVMLGTPLGRVGRTGRASADHLHFELRRPRGLDDRWEKAAVSDPIAWIEARRPVAREDSAWALPALAWAEGLGGLTAETSGDEPLTRAQWWRMLAAARPGPVSPTESPARLRRALEEQGLTPPAGPRRANEAPGIEEVRRDLEQVAALGSLAPAPGLDAVSHHVSVLAQVPWWNPDPSPPGRGSPAPRPSPLTVADAALLLLDVALSHQAAAGPFALPVPAPAESLAANPAR